jgi:type IX secretion system PorP/SprF family membrane protein
MKLERLIVLMAVCLMSSMLYAQQLPVYTQYQFNNFVYNPAIAGTNNYYQIRSNTRVQWVGIADHPLTNVLSVYGPHKSKDMGFGGSFFSDVTGPTSRTGIHGSYAYNVRINEDLRVSMGLSMGFMQYKVDGTNIDLWSEHVGLGADPLQDQVYTQSLPDATIGAYLYTYNYHFGFSSTQLLSNKIKLLDRVDTIKYSGVSKLKNHFFITGGYRYIINREWSVEPTMIMRYTGASPFQFDITTSAIYKNMITGGLAYRKGDALSIILGYLHEKQYYFGYSYDFATTAIRKYNSGSHEITIGYRFNEIR